MSRAERSRFSSLVVLIAVLGWSLSGMAQDAPPAEKPEKTPEHDAADIEEDPPAPETPEKVKGEVIINAVGDVALTTNAFPRVLNNLAETIFDPTREILKTGDLVFLNLETPLTTAPTTVDKKYAYTMPPSRLPWLLGAGFNMFSLANNHSADAGEVGVVDTLEHLEKARDAKGGGIWWSGTHRSAADAYKPTIIEVEGTTIAFLAVGNNADPLVNRLHRGRIAKAVTAMKENSDLVVLSVHWGKEYNHVPKDGTVHMYRQFVKAGADVILGHHPHVLRGVEVYRGGLIVHSLGNFAFSSKTIRHRETGAKLYGAIASIRIEGGKVDKLVLHPLYVNNLEPWKLGDKKLPPANFVPRPVTGRFADTVLDAVQEWSDAIDGNKVKIEREGDLGVVRMPR